jgi:hypothetical protein
MGNMPDSIPILLHAACTVFLTLLAILVVFVVAVEVVYVIEKTIRGNRLPLWFVGAFLAVIMAIGGVAWAVWR